VEVGVYARDAVAAGHAAGMRFVHISDGNHFDFRDGLVIIQVDLTDLTRANYTYAQYIVRGSLFGE
jgi:beta-phosphoglucomutase-like phosphatase (HAD superfamily)